MCSQLDLLRAPLVLSGFCFLTEPPRDLNIPSFGSDFLSLSFSDLYFLILIASDVDNDDLGKHVDDDTVEIDDEYPPSRSVSSSSEQCSRISRQTLHWP